MAAWDLSLLEELLKTDNIIAATSAFVAVLALGLTIWQGTLTRKHNRLSVRPHLVIETDSGVHEFEVKLTNNGLGPALIKRINVVVDGKPSSQDKESRFESLLKSLFENIDSEVETTEFGDNYVMAEKESVKIMKITFTGNNKPDPSAIKARLNSADLLIEYESFYNEPFKLDTSEHSRSFR